MITAMMTTTIDSNAYVSSPLLVNPAKKDGNKLYNNGRNIISRSVMPAADNDAMETIRFLRNTIRKAMIAIKAMSGSINKMTPAVVAIALPPLNPI